MRKIFTCIFAVLLFMHVYLLSCRAQDDEMITKVILSDIEISLSKMVKSHGLESGGDKSAEGTRIVFTYTKKTKMPLFI